MDRLSKNSRVIELESAVQHILSVLPAAASERLSLQQAGNRILSERLCATLNLPVFDNSAMDGYAVRAYDVTKARRDTPVSLRLCGRVPAGEVFTSEVLNGECVRIFTGSPLPRGADAVVMQEDTRVDSADTARVLIYDAVKPGENVRFSGTDVRYGTVLAEPGQVIRVGMLSLLAAAGITEVSVGRQPRVGLLATGSELREAGQRLDTGQIYESNRLMLAELVRCAGALPRVFPIVADTMEATQCALKTTFAESDVVVVSGGVSVGEMDLVKSEFQKLGGRLEFWKVAIRPGKPFVFGRWRRKFLFGLPGNPVSAFVTFLLLVHPALRRWQGAAESWLHSHTGTLGEPLSNPGDRRHFMRVRVDAAGKVVLAGTQASHALLSLATANGLVDVPPQTTWPAGSVVRVLRWF